jgi:hypothetical protein
MMYCPVDDMRPAVGAAHLESLMKLVLLVAALVSAAATPAFAQQAAPAAAPAASHGAALNGDSPIEEIAATAAGKATLDKNVPGLLAHAAYEQFKGMSLRALAPMSGGIITDEKIAAVEADLKAAK